MRVLLSMRIRVAKDRLRRRRLREIRMEKRRQRQRTLNRLLLQRARACLRFAETEVLQVA